METLLTFGKDELNSLSDGIVLLDAKGTITGIHRVPSHSLKRVLETRRRIADWVIDAVKGSLPLPAAVALQEGGRELCGGESGGKRATPCANGRRGYALVIRPDPRADEASIDPSIEALMGQDMQDKLRTKAALLRHFEQPRLVRGLPNHDLGPAVRPRPGGNHRAATRRDERSQSMRKTG